MIVVDNSVAVQWVFPEEQSTLALALLNAHLARGESIVAPHFLAVEFSNVIRQKMRRLGLSRPEAMAAMNVFFGYPFHWRPYSDRGRQSLHRLALELAIAHDLPATYDAHYLALAQTLRCDIWTADQRLLRQLGQRLAYVRDLREYTDDD